MRPKGCSKGRDRASVALNTYIAELHARALEKHKELVLEQALITPKLLLKRVFGKDTGMRTLLGTMQEGIKEMESLVNIDYSPVTINRYKNVVNEIAAAYPLLLWQGGHHLPRIDTRVHPCVRHLPENGRRPVPEHDSPLHEMFQEIHQYGIGKGMDAERPVLRLQDGTGRDRSGFSDLRRATGCHKEKIHGSPA